MDYPPAADRTWPPQIPETDEELAKYIVTWADRIIVRAQVDGTWGAVPLTSLPLHQALGRALQFLLEGRVPAVLSPHAADDNEDSGPVQT